MLCFMKAKGSLWSFSARMELFIYPHVVYVEHEEAHVRSATGFSLFHWSAGGDNMQR